MRAGTTPTYTIILHNVDLTLIDDVCLAFYQPATKEALYHHLSDGQVFMTDNGAYTTFSQEETNIFSEGWCNRQLKLKFTDGSVWSSDIVREEVIGVVHEEVL